MLLSISSKVCCSVTRTGSLKLALMATYTVENSSCYHQGLIYLSLC